MLMWLNINNLDKYDFLSKIGIRRDYCRRTHEWSYWNWEIWNRLKFISNIIDSSIGKNWDDVWRHILEKVPKKHHHLLTESECRYKPDYAFEENGILYKKASYGRIGKAFKNNIYINEDNILFIAYNGQEYTKFKTKKEKTKIKKPNNVPYIDKLIHAWVQNAEYVYFPKSYSYSRFNSKVINDYDYYNPWRLTGNINCFKWSYTDEEGERKSDSSTFNNMIRWFERNDKSYLILHKGHLFYSENFNKTMLK